VDINLALNGPQSRAFEQFQPRSNVCIPWGRGVGKSWFMRRMWYLAVAMYDGKVREGEDNGIRVKTRGVRIVHIQPTFKSCKDIHGDLTEAELGRGGDWEFLGGRINRTEWRIRFPGGSWIQWFGMKEAHASRGIRCDIVTSDESDDIDMASYDAVVAPWFTEKFSPEHMIRKALVGGTPRRGRYGLLYREHKAGLDKLPDCYSIHATYKDAPEVVDPAYIEAQKRKLSPEVFRREYECDFDSAEGLVYGIFNAQHHVREPDSRARWSEFLVGIDHGYEDPGVLLLAGVQGSGRDATIHLLDEVYQTKQTESWWIDAAKKLAKQYNLKTSSNPYGAAVRWFADPSRPDRIDAFNKAGIRVEGAKNAIDEGVDAVADRLVLRIDPNDQEGKRRFARLYVHPRCKETIGEFGKYRRRRDPKNPERVLDSIEDANNHAMDACRYLVYTRFGGPDRSRHESGPGWD
jgi:phage terminase large subunit